MNRVGWMLRVGLCLLALSCLSRAATGAPSVEANALFKAGQAYQKQAESAKSVATASALLEKAIEQYNRATRLQPDFHSAHALCSQCLLNLARYTTDPDQRRAQIKVAFERFDVAAKCSGTDWTSYQSWGQILLLAVDSLAAGTEDRRYILNEAHQAFEAGRPLTRFRRQRAEIESKLATCLALLAQAAHDEAEKLLLYRQAVERFDSVAKEPLENPTADYYAVWGMTLLRLGKLEHQLEFIRQATERLEKCLEKDPRRATPHYNLACCHALLNQPDEALRCNPNRA